MGDGPHGTNELNRELGPLWRRSAGRALILAALSVMLWAILPAVSQAAPEGDATIRSTTFTVNPGSSAPGQVFCPNGTRVVGGGVTQISGGRAYINVNGPLDETGLTSNLQNGDVGRSWFTSVHNETGNPASFAVTAICSAGSDATMRVAPFTVQPSDAAPGQAFCPGGSRVIGGGVTQASGVAGSLVNSSGPLDETGLTSNLQNGDVGRSWFSSVFNLSAAQQSYVSAAICSPASDATMRVAPISVPGTAYTPGQAFCPTDTRVVGGGVTQASGPSPGPGLPNTVVGVSGPLDETGLSSNLADGDVGRSYFANVQATAPANFVTAAICAPPPSTTASAVQKCHGKNATIAARPGVYGRRFTGTPNKDVIVGTQKKDKINAGKGNDLVCAGAGKDKVKGGRGKDKLFGQGGRDTLLGQAGKDLLSGGGKNDTCVGGPGKDREKSC